MQALLDFSLIADLNDVGLYCVNFHYSNTSTFIYSIQLTYVKVIININIISKIVSPA